MSQSTLDEEQSDYLQTITECSDSLLILVNDILELSKIETAGNNLPLMKHPYDICQSL